jgi:hypothetical protein
MADDAVADELDRVLPVLRSVLFDLTALTIE